MEGSLLNKINNPKDLKKLHVSDLPFLAKELRKTIIEFVATKEGHLGASLGVVELTIALHYVFDTPKDSLIWDVGHQAYAHKILTERKHVFNTSRQLKGLSGFPKISESIYDSFGTGHSSTSISAALGMAMASKIKGDHETQHIAVIGDASIASGMAFEGLNHAGVTDANLLVVLNDNAMGIDPSVGALKDYLMKAKIGQKSAGHNMIEALKFDYTGPIDGHDLSELLRELERLKSIKGPKFLHLITTKGKGLKKAEEEQVTYHSPGKFDTITGEIRQSETQNNAPKYQDVFGLTLLELARINKKIIGITPAMPTGSSLKYMIEAIPERAFDVGIAEQHAITLASGMALKGLIPYCTIYSTFLQRGYDQIIHDVALQNLPVVFCIDRAGIVGEDGPTHHGVFDISFLRCIPNLIIFAPQNEIDLRNILYTVQLGKLTGPIAIRYPRGRGKNQNWRQPFQEIEIAKGRVIKDGESLAILSIGTFGNKVTAVIEEFSDADKKHIAHYNMLFIKPLDHKLLNSIFYKFNTIITVEDNSIKGGFGSAIIEYSQEKGFINKKIKTLGIPDYFVGHGTTTEVFQSIKLDTDSLKETICEYL